MDLSARNRGGKIRWYQSRGFANHRVNEADQSHLDYLKYGCLVLTLKLLSYINLSPRRLRLTDKDNQKVSAVRQTVVICYIFEMFVPFLDR